MTNRLINEKSPYLLQHANNPVDWYPWGSEAFDEAKRLDKPIFLSIGYATCHWCHVMERESFEDPQVATLMNQAFINIKVDREERPEVDNVYMEFAQALMASSGGWPLNVVLTPDLKPIFAVTYLPPNSRKGMLGLTQFIGELSELWGSEKRGELIDQADRVVEMFANAQPMQGDVMPSEIHVRRGLALFFELADPIYGGIRGEPKFPLSYQFKFLMAYAKSTGDTRGHFIVDVTLDRMARGGIYDVLGGGFSRYAVDAKWQVPHFEKMLYDNGLLAKTYADAWRVTRKPLFEEISRATLDYILREMTSPDGGFYSAEDADSEGHEGLFYTWTYEEIKSLLNPEEADLFCRYYSVAKQGSFEGRSILFAEFSPEEFSEKNHIELNHLNGLLKGARSTLLKKRLERTNPFKDDKILSGWNGLAIDALVSAGTAFGEPRYLEAAVKAGRFLKKNLWKEGKLLRRYRDGDARFSAGLDEYAFLIKGILSLFEAHCGSEWLRWAIEMTELLTKDFKVEGGAFYPTDGQEPLPIRKCEYYDGSEPSGNGVHAENLIRLYQITQDERYLIQAEDIFKAAKQFIETYPPGATYHLLSLQRYLDAKGSTLVIALDSKKTNEKEISEMMGKHFCPHTALIWKDPHDADLSALLPNIKDKDLMDGLTTVYACTQDRCGPPVVNLPEILKILEKTT